jgi:hypothetical protein
MYELHSILRYILIVFYSFWVPQIVANVVRDSRKPLHPHYILGMTFTRLAIPLYTFGCPRNFMRVETSSTWCIGLTAFMCAQAGVLLLQHYMGARCFIPRQVSSYSQLLYWMCSVVLPFQNVEPRWTYVCIFQSSCVLLKSPSYVIILTVLSTWILVCFQFLPEKYSYFKRADRTTFISAIGEETPIVDCVICMAPVEWEGRSSECMVRILSLEPTPQQTLQGPSPVQFH